MQIGTRFFEKPCQADAAKDKKFMEKNGLENTGSVKENKDAIMNSILGANWNFGANSTYAQGKAGDQWYLESFGLEDTGNRAANKALIANKMNEEYGIDATA